MWHDHPHLTVPPDDTPLWRYMDIAKFVSILDREALYFANLSVLGDPYEGVETRPFLEKMRRDWAAREVPPGIRTIGDILDAMRVESRTWIFVSCWHMNEIESAAMWSQYLKSGEGVAIRTTFSRMRGSFPAEREVMGGVVDYLDYDTDMPGHENPLRLGCTKRKSFEHEREFRAAVFWPLKEIPPEAGNADGVYIPVNIATLIEDVYVAPHAPAWQAKLIKSLLLKYGHEKDVHHSTLYQRPPYLPPDGTYDWFINERSSDKPAQ